MYRGISKNIIHRVTGSDTLKQLCPVVYLEFAEAEEMSSVLDAEIRRLSDSVDGMCAKLLELVLNLKFIH